MKTRNLVLALCCSGALAVTAAAQETVASIAGCCKDMPKATVMKGDTLNVPLPETKPATPAPATVSLYRPIEIQRTRPLDMRGLLMFEYPKTDPVPFRGFVLSWGAAFTQQFQGLTHDNGAAPKMAGTVNQNELMGIGNGFNNAAANLYLNAQLAPGIRVALESYLSSRHHNESWVKDGYLLIDESPLKIKPLENLMKYVTVKAGHFEVNYGDAHFRRSDNGNALYNPFVGNLILDAFTTEIGGEVYVRARDVMVMGSVTGGEVKGTVQTPGQRSPSYIGKIGYDKQMNTDLRVRLTGSAYRNYKSGSNTLYSGDRAGSRYFLVMENTAATAAAAAWSGNVNPGFKNTITSFQVNPFVKFRGLEFFGVDEMSKGKANTEKTERVVHQYSGDLVYRFFDGEKMYVGARYNRVNGALAGLSKDISVDRQALAAGWFVTPGVVLKGELVTQKYNDFPTTDIRHEGKFKGFVVEGVVAF
jgi:hypothetical protein